MGEVIGEGKFGIVRKALYNENFTVAVKSLKGLKDFIGSFSVIKDFLLLFLNIHNRIILQSNS